MAAIKSCLLISAEALDAEIGRWSRQRDVANERLKLLREQQKRTK